MSLARQRGFALLSGHPPVPACALRYDETDETAETDEADRADEPNRANERKAGFEDPTAMRTTLSRVGSIGQLKPGTWTAPR